MFVWNDFKIAVLIDAFESQEIYLKKIQKKKK